MSTKLPSALCAHCSAIIHEGDSAMFDEQANEYFCGEDCVDEWLADQLDAYKRKNITEVDM